jgi:hypothetical protein
MLWLRWKTLPGSQASLRAVSRASLAGGYALVTPAAPSSVSALTYAPLANGPNRAADLRACAIRSASSAGSVQRAAATYSKAASRWLNAVASSGTSAIAPP